MNGYRRVAIFAVLVFLATAGCAQGGSNAQATADGLGDGNAAGASNQSANANLVEANTGAAQPATDAGSNPCRDYLTGVWTFQGDYEFVGERQHADVREDYRSDGSFEIIRRTRRGSEPASDAREGGTYATRPNPGMGGGNCELRLTYTQYGQSGFSHQDFAMNDEGTREGAGYVLRRQAR